MKLKALSSGLAVAGALMASAAQAQDHQINLGHVLSERSGYHIVFETFKELVEERSEGRIAVDVKCCAQAGSELRSIQSVRTGVLTGAFVGGSSLETVVSAFRVVSLPYVFDNTDQAYDILGSEVGAEMLKELEPFNMVGLGWGPIYERNIGSRGVAINAAEDIQGVKIRVLQTPGFVEAYKALGAQSTPMPYGELYLALQNGVVDANEASPSQMVGDRFIEVVDHYALTGIHQSTTVFILSKSFLDNLPGDLQDLVRVAAKDAIETGVAAHRKLEEEGLKQLRAEINVTEPDLAGFMEASRASYEVILAEAPEARALLERIEAAKQGQ